MKKKGCVGKVVLSKSWDVAISSKHLSLNCPCRSLTWKSTSSPLCSFSRAVPHWVLLIMFSNDPRSVGNFPPIARSPTRSMYSGNPTLLRSTSRGKTSDRFSSIRDFVVPYVCKLSICHSCLDMVANVAFLTSRLDIPSLGIMEKLGFPAQLCTKGRYIQSRFFQTFVRNWVLISLRLVWFSNVMMVRLIAYLFRSSLYNKGFNVSVYVSLIVHSLTLKIQTFDEDQHKECVNLLAICTSPHATLWHLSLRIKGPCLSNSKTWMEIRYFDCPTQLLQHLINKILQRERIVAQPGLALFSLCGKLPPGIFLSLIIACCSSSSVCLVSGGIDSL